MRLKALRTSLLKGGRDAVLLTSPSNISYVTDSISRDSWLLVSAHSAYYITDSRYTEEAKRTLSAEFKVVQVKHTLLKTLISLVMQDNLSSIGFEANHLSFQLYKIIKEHLEKAQVAFEPLYETVEPLREVKSKQEVELMREAIRITADAYSFCKGFLEPGLTELEVAAEIERRIRQQGASSASFDIIVASGPSASYPHYLTSGRKLRENEPVLIDMGVTYKGYKSDLTRVFFVGKISILARRIYDIVLRAQEKAIKLVKPGVKASAIDDAARSTIAKAGYGRYFGHGTGHGVGLDVHERPAISRKNLGILLPGMVFTVEPGIYLPNKAGVRIEDMVLVTGKGVEVLSGFVDK